MINLYSGNNLEVMEKLFNDGTEVDLIYGDCIYESKDFTWLKLCYNLLKPNGIFMVQTDYHTVADYKILLDLLYGEKNFVNWIITIQEWGGVSKRWFPRKHDDILIYHAGKDYKFYPERVMIPKATAGTKLDKRGDGLKIPCDVFYDLGNFSTISKERIKLDGKNIRWQKQIRLMERLILSFTDEGETVLDPFLGSGTTGVVCSRFNRSFIGIEIDPVVYELAEMRIKLWSENVDSRVL